MNKRTAAALLTGILVMIIAVGLHFFNSNDKQKSEIKVGFIYVGDESTAYTANFIKAQNAIEEKYGDSVVTEAKYNVSEDEVETPLKELIDSGCDLIFTTSYGYGETVKEFAKKYSDIEFCQATCSNANDDPVLTNYHTFMGEVYQGRYVSGVVAGLKLKELIADGVITADEAKVGYVAAYPYAEVISGYTAFFLGVRSVVPDAVMTVTYADSWSNYTVEKKLAKSLIEDGCIIISQHSDTEGPAAACEEMSEKYTVFHVGYNQSMTDVAPTTSLISCRINWTPYELTAVQAVLDGETIEDNIDGITAGNDSWGGFKESWVQMLDLNELIAAKGTAEYIEETISALEEKSCKVFYGSYVGVDPYDSEDTIDLSVEYTENESTSAPAFHYVLQDVITVKEFGD
jgi:basic membrane protein A